MSGVSIGLDIGVASVGYSVLNTENGDILECGVSIFSSASPDNNKERRSFRGSKRLKRRRTTRLMDLKKIFEIYDIISIDKFESLVNDKKYKNPYELRVNGLNEKLSNEELAFALYHIAKRRGISYDLGDLELDEDKKTSNYKASININQKLLQEGKTPGEIQLERLEKYGQVRGQIKGDKWILLNVFPTKDYSDEANRILNKQKEFNENISDEFIQEVIKIITRKREYYEGPGSEKSRTDYGIYKTDGRTLDNLFEELIGRDKIYPDEFRAAGNSYTAQLFNLLNDLNNLRIINLSNLKMYDGKLTKEMKEKIINKLKETTTTLDSKKVMNIIAEIAGCKVEDIKGYRINEKGKPEIHSMQVYRKVRKDFLELEEPIDIANWSINFIDEISAKITLNTEKAAVRKQLEMLKDKYDINENLIQKILDNLSSFDLKSNNKWHRFSLKTMKELIPEMLQTSKEQHTLLVERSMIKSDYEKYSGKKNVPIKMITDEIYNPVVSKSVKESLKIFNALLDKYNNQIEYLVIEMPRDKNEKEERDNIQKMQKQNKEEKDNAFEYFKSKVKISELEFSKKLKGKNFATMIRLWYLQEEIDPYSGKQIEAIELLQNKGNFEIDHIIPLSVSFDDSLNNKVLVRRSENQRKAKQTPYQYMQNEGGQGFASFTKQVKANKRYSDRKKKKLLFSEDINNMEVRKRFIARNLVDTRYASRVVLNEINSFIKANNMEIKVSVVRGKWTSTLRKIWSINKNRDTHHHHAIDATIVAVSPLIKLFKETDATMIATSVDDNFLELENDISKVEIIDDEEFKGLAYQTNYESFLSNVTNEEYMYKMIKFNHEVDKKVNRAVANQQMRSTRKFNKNDDEQEDYIIATIKDIYSYKKNYKKFKEKYDKDPYVPNKVPSVFLMRNLDNKSFEKLEKIMKDYPDKEEVIQSDGTLKTEDVSPFEMYRRENGYITKYAKKNNGPVIKSLKYYDEKLGSHIDITPDTAKNKKVVLLKLKSWRTDVYYNHNKKEYEIMGIKYADLKYSGKNNYGIDIDKYNEIKNKEKVSDKSEFCFSLYRGDRIKVEDTNTNESIELLFGSRNCKSTEYGNGNVELKPIDRVKFDKYETVSVYENANGEGKIKRKFAKKGFKIYKVNTDVLGNPHYIKKEKLRGIKNKKTKSFAE
ncbi:MAG: type II CRISPR RNA-guided endonuclease Cas9 [Clostridioides sp.]|jgi:CRISPR-associated endonuclease Csn1|nr:type II CRISPR RNA-guided endonuclease Cas9 [Clostridioides sp.]